jgi:hypothetical protein
VTTDGLKSKVAILKRNPNLSDYIARHSLSYYYGSLELNKAS